MAAKPANYNTSAQSIRVDPDGLWITSTRTLVDLSTDVSETLSNIVTQWNTLKLSWHGGTADEVADFNTKWAGLLDKLFGPENADANTEYGPNQAILLKVASAAATAGSNFGQAEDAVIKVFQPFIDMAPGAPGSGRDHRSGPIWEINTPKIPGA